MKPGGGHLKGTEFERLTCKQLSLWISGGKRQDLFWRSAMSGGRSTIQLKKGIVNKAQSGDISSIDRLGQDFIDRFIIECKSYGDLNFDSSFLKYRGLLFDFWKYLYKISAKYDKNPILIAKQNYFPTIFLACYSDNEMIMSLDRIITLHQWRGAPGVYYFDDLIKSEYRQ